jgi:hypothetical protein
VHQRGEEEHVAQPAGGATHDADPAEREERDGGDERELLERRRGGLRPDVAGHAVDAIARRRHEEEERAGDRRSDEGKRACGLHRGA